MDGIVNPMETRSAPEDFMRRFFKERTETWTQMLELRRPFRERFYDPNCVYDSRTGSRWIMSARFASFTAESRIVSFATVPFGKGNGDRKHELAR